MDTPFIPPDYTTGEALFIKRDPKAYLIESILFEEDVVMVLGSEKAGKSILSMQICCALTSGEPFLDKYGVKEKVPIVYFQTEGKKNDFFDRMACMRSGVDIDPSLFHHFYRKFLPFDHPEVIKWVDSKLQTLLPPPRVIVLDSLYTSMEGDLIENTDIRRFIAMISPLLEKYKLTLLLIHHESKETFDPVSHSWIERGDKGSYGSVFLRAYVEHILYLKAHKDKSRTFSCSTQRSGKVSETKEELILIEPDPLIFQVKGDHTPSTELIRSHVFKSGPLSREDIAKFTLISDSGITKGLRILLRDKILCKSNSRPTLYAVYGHQFES